MKPTRDFAFERTLVAGFSWLAVEGCNLILGNESIPPDDGSSAMAGTGVSGAAAAGTSAEAGAGPDEFDGGSGGTAGTSVSGAAAGGTAGASTSAGAGQTSSTEGGSGASSGGTPGMGGEEDPPPGPLAAPSGVEFTPTSETAGTVTWEAVDEATTYSIELATDANFMDDRKVASPTETTTMFSGLNAGKRYHVRVRANGSHDRVSEWSEAASSITPLNAPTASLSLIVDISVAVRYPGTVLWLEEPPDGNGQYYTAQGTASAKCPTGTTVEYRFDANYDSAARKGYSAWSTTNVAYITAPNENARITYYLGARCKGPDATSSASPEVSACRRRNNAACS